MKIRVYSVQYDISQKYKDVLDKYNLEEEVEDYLKRYNGELFPLKAYYITINTLEELFNLIKELQQDLIINYEDDSITIYDGYIE